MRMQTVATRCDFSGVCTALARTVNLHGVDEPVCTSVLHRLSQMYGRNKSAQLGKFVIAEQNEMRKNRFYRKGLRRLPGLRSLL